jgi:hypothetical protein
LGPGKHDQQGESEEWMQVGGKGGGRRVKERRRRVSGRDLVVQAAGGEREDQSKDRARTGKTSNQRTQTFEKRARVGVDERDKATRISSRSLQGRKRNASQEEGENEADPCRAASWSAARKQSAFRCRERQ